MELDESKKAKAGKLLGKIIIGAVVLLLLLAGGGVAYTWFMGQESDNSAAFAEPVDPKPVAQTAAPVKTDPKAPASASIQLLTSPVEQAANASMDVRTNPLAKCEISVIYDKAASTDSGLKAKTADEFGMVSWTWTVETSAAIGKWPVKVTCAHNKKSAVVSGDLQVIKPAITP